MISDFASLKKQLKDCSDSTQELINPEIISLLKGAVLAIDEGLKTIYESSHDVNTVVFGRSHLIDQLINSTYNHLSATVPDLANSAMISAPRDPAVRLETANVCSKHSF